MTIDPTIEVMCRMMHENLLAETLTTEDFIRDARTLAAALLEAAQTVK